MFTKNAVKIIGIIATVAGFGATLLSDWVNEKKMDERIELKVNEVLAEKEDKDTEEDTEKTEEES